MAEHCEPGRQGSAGGGNPEEEEDEEREPLLPPIAWAWPRRGAPGRGARRLQVAAGEDGAAVPARPATRNRRWRPRTIRLPLGVPLLRGSSADLSQNRAGVQASPQSESNLQSDTEEDLTQQSD